MTRQHRRPKASLVIGGKRRHLAAVVFHDPRGIRERHRGSLIRPDWSRPSGADHNHSFYSGFSSRRRLPADGIINSHHNQSHDDLDFSKSHRQIYAPRAKRARRVIRYITRKLSAQEVRGEGDANCTRGQVCPRNALTASSFHQFLSAVPLTIRFAHRKFSAHLAHETLFTVCDCGCGRIGHTWERRNALSCKATAGAQYSGKPERPGKRRYTIGAHSR